MTDIHFVKENLAVCGISAIGSRQEFEKHGFQAHLQCTTGFDDWLKEHVEVKLLPFEDTFPIPKLVFVDAQNWFSGHWKKQHKILISCSAGESRSVSVAIGLLYLIERDDFLNICSEVFNKIPGAYPHPNTLISAAIHCDVAITFNELKDLYNNIRIQPPFPWTDELLKEALAQYQNF